jgi:hypothetical protein
MDSDTPIIIAGMHRSGTSLVARFIHHSGIDLGDEFVGAKRSNPYGHFEDVEILEFQRGVLMREFGHSMWVPGPPRLTDADRGRAMDLVSARKTKSCWGWKEPRTCLFLDFWSSLLPGAYCLFVVRHPLLVLDSLSRRNRTKFYTFWKHDRFLQAWFAYNRECFRFYQQNRSRCILVMLEWALTNPDLFADLLTERLAFGFDGDLFRTLYDPMALAREQSQRLLVSPRLRNRSLGFFERMQRVVAMQAS